MEQGYDRIVTLASKRKMKVHTCRKWEACNVQQKRRKYFKKMANPTNLHPKVQSALNLFIQPGIGWGLWGLMLVSRKSPGRKVTIMWEQLQIFHKHPKIQLFMGGANLFLFLACAKKREANNSAFSIQLFFIIFDQLSLSGGNLFKKRLPSDYKLLQAAPN